MHENNSIYSVEITTPNKKDTLSIYALRHFAKMGDNSYLTRQKALDEIGRVNSLHSTLFYSRYLEDGSIEYSDPRFPDMDEHTIKWNPNTGAIDTGKLVNAHITIRDSDRSVQQFIKCEGGNHKHYHAYGNKKIVSSIDRKPTVFDGEKIKTTSHISQIINQRQAILQNSTNHFLSV